MSFILDALKKLEQKKQDASVPDLLTVHTAEQYEGRKKSIWPLLLIVLLILNAAIFSYWLFTDKPEDIVVAKVDTHERPEQTARDQKERLVSREIPKDRTPEEPVQSAAVTEAVLEKAPESIVPVREKPLPLPVPEETAVQKEKEAAVPVATGEDINDAETGGPVLEQLIREASRDTENMAALQSETKGITDEAQDPVSASDLHPLSTVESDQEKQIPTLSELPADIRNEIPSLTIVAHIYSNDPSSRMVNINGDVLREGEELSGKFKVEEITISGVTVLYKDHVFRLRAF